MRTLAVLLCTLTAALDAQVTVIRAGRLLDPATGRVAQNQSILVDAGRIKLVAPSIAVPVGAEVVDLTTLTVLPGLIDAHVHLGIGGPPRDNALADLRAGFTTVVDLGARTTRLLRIRDSINAGQIPGPRVLAAGIWVGTKNGVCEFNGIGLAGGPDVFRARVRENVDAGADLIKVCVSGWPAQAWAQPESYEIADDALQAVVTEAHASKKLVIAHDISGGGVNAALRDSVDGLAHAAYVGALQAIAMQKRGMFMVSTLASLTDGDTSQASLALIGSMSGAYRTGVTIVFGTDGGVLPHGQNAREFLALRKAGISSLDAIRAATVTAARSLRLADSLGVIAPGMLADIIAVEGDPLADITALQRPKFIMSRGRIILK